MHKQQARAYVPIRARQRKEADGVGESQHVENPYVVARFFPTCFFVRIFLIRMLWVCTRLFLHLLLLLKSQQKTHPAPTYLESSMLSSSIYCKHRTAQRNKPCAKEQSTYIRTHVPIRARQRQRKQADRVGECHIMSSIPGIHISLCSQHERRN